MISTYKVLIGQENEKYRQDADRSENRNTYKVQYHVQGVDKFFGHSDVCKRISKLM
jgi:hypothetical protein